MQSVLREEKRRVWTPSALHELGVVVRTAVVLVLKHLVITVLCPDTAMGWSKMGDAYALGAQVTCESQPPGKQLGYGVTHDQIMTCNSIFD